MIKRLDELVRRLVEGFRPQRIILFGSQARGSADPRSDVDLLIICPTVDDRRCMCVAMDRALRGLGLARDIVVMTPEEFERERHIPGSIARPASLEGQVLYDSAA